MQFNYTLVINFISSFSILIVKGMVDITDAKCYLGCPQYAYKPSAALLVLWTCNINTEQRHSGLFSRLGQSDFIVKVREICYYRGGLYTLRLRAGIPEVRLL
jgi:hypothetical protein